MARRGLYSQAMPDDRISRLLVGAAAIGLKHPVATIVLSLVLSGLSIASGFGMRFSADVADLAPQAMVGTLRRLEDVLGAGESAFLLAASPTPDGEGLVEFARTVRRQLEGDPWIESVTYGWSELAGRMAAPEALSAAPLFTPGAELEELDRLLTPEGIAAAVKNQALRLGLPGLGQAEEWAARDPLNLARFLAARASSLRGEFRFLPGSFHFLSEDGRAILVRIDARARSADIPAVKAIVAAIEAAVARAKEERRRHGGRPDLEVSLTGGYAYAVETEALVRHDLTGNSFWSSVLVVGLVAIAYRRLALVIPSFLALGLGMVLGFGAFSLIRREVVTLAFVSGAILAGIGIDYVIYVTLEAFSDPAGPRRESVLAAVQATGRAILFAALTTAAAFLSFLLTGERFLHDLGLLSAVGIIACIGAAVFILPALLVPWLRAEGPGSAARSGAGAQAPRDLRPRDLGAGLLVAGALAWPRAVLALSIVSGAFCAAYLAVRPPGLERDFRKVHSPDSAAVRTQAAIAATFGGAESPLFVIVEGASPPAAPAPAAVPVPAVMPAPAAELVPAMEDGRGRGEAEVAAVEAAGRLEGELRALLERGVIAAWSSPAALVPPAAEQRAALDLLLRKDPARLAEALRLALEEEGFEVGMFAGAIDTLRAALRPASLVTPALLRRLGLEGEIDRLVGEGSDGKGYALVAVHPPSHLWMADEQDRLSAELRGALERSGVRGEVAGLQVLSGEGAAAIFRSFLRVSALAAAAAVVLVLVLFRRLLYSALALLPVVLGTLWAAVACDALGIRLHFMNIGVLPMVLGTGIDLGIHLVKRYADDRTGDVRGLLERSGGALMLAAVTTLASFGSMAFSSSPGLASVGIIASLGMTGCIIASLVTLPALLALHARRRR